MKVLRFLVRLVGGAVGLFLLLGFTSTLYQVITGNVICCNGDPVKLGMPVGLYLVLAPIVLIVVIFRIFWRRRK
jgi:hypothetical protein